MWRGVVWFHALSKLLHKVSRVPTSLSNSEIKGSQGFVTSKGRTIVQCSDKHKLRISVVLKPWPNETILLEKNVLLMTSGNCFSGFRIDFACQVTFGMFVRLDKVNNFVRMLGRNKTSQNTTNELNWSIVIQAIQCFFSIKKEKGLRKNEQMLETAVSRCLEI